MMFTSANCRYVLLIIVMILSARGAFSQDFESSVSDTTAPVYADTIALARTNAAGVQNTQLEAAAVTWRIMPLGDSITKGHASAGSSPEGGYRDDLSALLKKEGVAFDFVGSQATGSGFDRNHEGHSGKTADFIDANVTSFLQARKPQIVLLHIGTNDISQNETPASTANEIAAILDKIRSYNSSVSVVLSSTIPRKDNRNAHNDDLARRIEDVYYEKRAAGYRVFYAGQNEMFKNDSNYKNTYLYDFVHPNNTGYNLLAEVFFNHLLTALSAGDANITDNFNRQRLGKTWAAAADYEINGNQLHNASSDANWNDLAVYVAQTNPDAVSLRLSDAASSGVALRLHKPAADASGYLAYIDSDAMLQLWTIEQGARGHLVQSGVSGLAAPQPGDVLRVAMRSDPSGHYFDFYLNDLFAGQLADFNKELGNSDRAFAGVMLRGGANNAVDDLVLGRMSAPVAPMLTVTAPNGGENWQAGSQHNISWSSQGSIPNVTIEFSNDNGATWSVIASNTANDGSHAWNVPNALSNQCLIKISDAADGDPADVSNQVFSIVEAGTASNYALRFDGAEDYVEIPDNALLSGGAGKSITVEAWIKPEAITGTRPILEKFLDGSNKDWGMQISDGVVEVGIESSGDNWGLEGGSVPAGAWTHLSFTFDNAANLVKLYVNGVLASQKSLTKDMPDTRAVIRFGRHGYATSYFAGEIDEVRVWNFARSAADIGASMNSELAGNESGLIGYWNFNEGSGQTANDASGRGNIGRLGASTSADAGDPAWVNSSIPVGSTPVAEALQITSPNGGEIWQPGSTQYITWNSQGAISAVNLEYSTNGGATWTSIVSNTANDGTQGLTVPNEISNQCLVRVTDAGDGNPSDASNAVFSISTVTATTTLTFQPAHDAYVRSSTPTSIYGSTATLRVRNSSSETLISYLKFDVNGLSGQVQSAKLRLYVTDPSADGGWAYSVSNNYNGSSTAWTQSGLNWSNAPAITGAALSSAGAVSAGGWIELEVTPAISGNGVFSFAVKSNASDVVYFSSREGSYKPVLVIQSGASAAATRMMEAGEFAETETLPETITLKQNYPNPFNAQTIIEYSLPQSGAVRLAIFNVLGQEVRLLVNGEQSAGSHHAVWDGKNNFGDLVGSGSYFYVLEVAKNRFTGRMILQQ